MLMMSTALLFSATVGSPQYGIDATWKPDLPVGGGTYSGVAVANDPKFPKNRKPVVYVTQRGNASISPVLMLDGLSGELIDQWGKTEISRAPGPTGQWGDHGVVVENCNYPCVASKSKMPFTRVWIEDFNDHTVTAYTAEGKKLLQVGTPGTAGNGTAPLQFGNVADAAIATGNMAPSAPPGPTTVYATDGDGGSANRVVKFSVASTEAGYKFEWATQQIYNNPHSIALHKRTNLLIVADRGHNATRILSADTGKDLGIWDCGLGFGAGGTPFGVRTLSYGGYDMVLVASMDNPQDHRNQRITLLDASKLNEEDGGKSGCAVIQSIPIDPADYSGPHLLAVDETTGNFYAALVSDTPKSTVLKYTCSFCKG